MISEGVFYTEKTEQIGGLSHEGTKRQENAVYFGITVFRDSASILV